MWPNPQFSADLVTFTEEILNEKLYFLCSDCQFGGGVCSEWLHKWFFILPLKFKLKTVNLKRDKKQDFDYQCHSNHRKSIMW